MKNIKKYVFVALIGLFFTLGLPKVSATTWYGCNLSTYEATSYRFNYNYSGSSTGELVASNIGVFGTTYTGKATAFAFYANKDHNNTDFIAGSRYEITFIAPTYDLTNNWTTAGIEIYGYYPVGDDTICMWNNEYSTTPYTVNSVTMSGQSGTQYSTVAIVFTATSSRDYVYISVSNSSPLTGVSNFKIQNAYIKLLDSGEEEDATNSDIIENQNQNTQSIIQNNEQNKNDIINNNNENTGKLVQELQNFADKIQASQDKTNDLITDETPPELEGLEDAVGWLPPGPVDSILNLPLAVFQSLSNSLGKTCEPVQLPIPYINETLELPCVSSLYAKMGVSDYIETIGIIASAFILLGYLLNLYKWVDDQLSLRENTWNDMDQWGGV